MRKDPIVAEVHKTREKLFAKAGHDLATYLKKADENIRRHPGLKLRMVDLRGKAKLRQQKVAA